MNFIYFGTDNFSVNVLEKLRDAKLIPSLIITKPDKPSGRGMKLTAPEVKEWAEKNSIAYLQPNKFDDEFMKILKEQNCDIYVVASYGKIIPMEILSLPKHGVLNLHPSLLPLLRGPSPIQYAILFENKTGITIMKMDEEMDHGPIIAQKEILSWNDDNVPYASELFNILSKEGGGFLAEILPDWVNGSLKMSEQDHSSATYSKLIAKEEAYINLAGNALENLKKIRAFDLSPRAYSFFEKRGKKIRAVITKAKIHNNQLQIEKIIPEGGKEVNFEEFQKSS